MSSEPEYSVDAEKKSIAATAAAWVARRDAGLDRHQRAQLRAWLGQDPRHAEAFSRADRTAIEFDPPLHAETIDAVLFGLKQRNQRRRLQRRKRVAGLTVVAIALGLSAFWFPRPSSLAPPESSVPSLIVTTPRHVTLPDGTIVELKDEARIATEFSATQRKVTLLAGTAHFQVAKRDRPFVVTAGAITAEAVGTAYSVELEQNKVSVLVTEGVVLVKTATSAPPQNATEKRIRTATTQVSPTTLAVLDAGKTVSVNIENETPKLLAPVNEISAPVREDRLAWRIPQLEFSGTTLREVVEMMNQHNPVKFVIADRKLEEVTLSGVLRADKADVLVRMLESDFSIKAEQQGDRIVLRR